MALLKRAAVRHCGGRLVAVHEGGYSDVYVPFCGLAAIEALAGLRSKVSDPYLEDVQGFGWQALQPHQDAVLRRCEAHVARLATRLAASGSASGGGGSSSGGNGSGSSAAAARR
ncbi:histone deacetylase family protein [Monoraphidium neglectum]|uniref:Histone deacetylase family protein n=1 Tax=Monoraphidium neglectum TaxID=145388 RepID=A0A0D2MDV2_9CHLO|nr:histone deacetylase family protein [Monoraphidium neglectum]KIY93395.1 histone deacetylase family protein [Monoraphidium neglectum]|eukprot:XP_013892415.1 histone deacetylase family protein [Monoraphidium neglectum]